MFSSILIYLQLSYNQQTKCLNSIIINNNQHSFCQKSNTLNSQKVQSDLYLSQKQRVIHVFLYTEYTQKTTVNSQLYNYDVNVFALFGFAANGQFVSDSLINISLNFEVLQGALLCISCDMHIINSTTVFIATGHIISALIIEAHQTIQLQQTLIQYRAFSGNSSGIVNIINSSALNFSIIDCRLAGSDLMYSSYNGYLSAAIFSQVTISIQKLLVCVNNISKLGSLSVSIIWNGSDSQQCDICDGIGVVYGLCSEALKFGKTVNGTEECVYPFEYINNSCVCARFFVKCFDMCGRYLSHQQCVQLRRLGYGSSPGNAS
ncbi:Hypothetical_protein [Hexamita inflata]|uniref:Hypothetical_protein n=1 Tax=Hexamita inflata TaxID=28002 RepID=A0AA86QWF7_9EUKA|nr:Hypothetical protein HINF_LOCUS50291 [Hexamita inflata]